jgi:diguanylate cyclase (GGDEF)-like protein
MRYLVAATLVAAALLQCVAALLAVRAMPRSGQQRFPWIALSLALVLMVERRIQPLFDFHEGLSDLTDALYALSISGLIAFSVVGLVKMLREIRANEENLARLAITDSLTGISNRRHLFSELEQELRRANRNGHPVSVLMADLDHFKAINDRHGHGIGDVVLVEVAARCTKTLRSVDLYGRVGGEEFVVVLPETNADAAAIAAERVRNALSGKPITTVGGPLEVTISLGIATHDPRHPNAGEPPGENVSELAQCLLRRADAALYEAKGSGRNCVRGDGLRPSCELDEKSLI